MPEVLALGAIADVGLGAGEAAALGGALDFGAGAVAADVGLGLTEGAALTGAEGAAFGAGALGGDIGLGADLGLGAIDTSLGGGVAAMGESSAALEGAAAPDFVGSGLGDTSALSVGDAGGAASQPTGLTAELGGSGAGGTDLGTSLGGPELNIGAGDAGAPSGVTGGPEGIASAQASPFQISIDAQIGGAAPEVSDVPASLRPTDNLFQEFGTALDPQPQLQNPGSFGPGTADNPMIPGSFEANTLTESLNLGPGGELANSLDAVPTGPDTPAIGMAPEGFQQYVSEASMPASFESLGWGDMANIGGGEFPAAGDAVAMNATGTPTGAMDALGLGDMTNLETGTTWANPLPGGSPAGTSIADPWAATVSPSPSGAGAPLDLAPEGGAGAGGEGFGAVPAGGSLAPGGAGASGVLGGLGLNAGSLLGLGGVGALAFMGPGKLPAQAIQASQQASSLGSSGQQMLADAQAGKITPAQQAQLDQMLQEGEANLRTQFARMGRDPNSDSSFQYALAQLKAQVEAQRQQFIDQMQAQGLAQLNLSEQALSTAASQQVALDTNFQTALANALGASSRLIAGGGTSPILAAA